MRCLRVRLRTSADKEWSNALIRQCVAAELRDPYCKRMSSQFAWALTIRPSRWPASFESLKGDVGHTTHWWSLAVKDADFPGALDA